MKSYFIFLVTLIATFVVSGTTLAEEKAKMLKPEDIYYLKICQTEQTFSIKPKDLFKCIEDKKKNKDYSDYMKYETFEDLKY